MDLFSATPQPAEARTGFVGRVQEQRQFLVTLQGLLAHHQRWTKLAKKFGPEFDFESAPGDDSYANIFLPHGIGGIGKSWLTRRCLTLAQGIPTEPAILTLYDDVSLGAPVLEPAHILDRLATQLEQAGHEMYLAAYRQAKSDTPAVVERVTRYQFENREQWDKLVKLAVELVARHEPETGYQSFAETSLAYLHASGAETSGQDAPTLVKAYDLLLDQMKERGKLKPEEAALFRNPPATQATKLVTALKQIALQQPLVIGLDNLEIIVPLEPLIRDSLVMPTNQSPIIWLLSGRYNLADERMVELKGGPQLFKGYRDLLGENPPVVWDMSIFGDADLRDYLEAEAQRRHAHLLVDDDLIEAIKATSSGVPLVVEMVTDALFTMGRDEFLREFALDDRSLLPGDRLNKITGRFLRYCLTHADDMERVQAMALLRKGADDPALAAAWRLPATQSVGDVLYGLRIRYAFVLPEGLHDAVYDFVRRQLRTAPQSAEARERLSRRAVDHYQATWDKLQANFNDSTLRIRNPDWQRATRDLLNALLWNNPDRAVLFLLPRFVEGLGFDRAFSNGLLLQAEEFLTDSISTFSDSYANLLHHMRVGMQQIDWTFDEPGEAIGAMLENLLDAPGLAPLHLSILHLWQGNWQVENGNLAAGQEAYRQADAEMPKDAVGLHGQLGKAWYEISSRFLWPESAAETVPSEAGLQAALRATELDPENGGAWFNYGVGLDYLGRHEESISAYRQAIKLEPRPNTYNNLGDVFAALSRDEEAMEAYRQAIELDPAYAWPYHNLGLLHADQGNYEAALEFYRQAIEHHQHDKERAITWDNFGDAYAVLGNHEEAISAYRWAGVLYPAYAPPWYGLGNVYSAQKRHREAIEAYQKCITLDAGHAWARHKLGQVYAGQGDYATAIPYYRQAIERHEDDRAGAITWNSLGDVYTSLDRHHDAIEAYRQAIKLDPAQAEAWANLGDVYVSLGNTEAAVNAYRRAVEIEPDYAAPWNSLGNIYTAQEQYDAAIDAFRQVIRLEPEYAWPYNNLGFIYSRRREFDKARKFYRQAIEHHTDDESRAVSWSNLGDVHVAVDNSDEAIKAYRQATVLAPDYAWPYHNLAEVHEGRGEYEPAIDLYRQAIDRHAAGEDRAVSWFNLADIYQQLGRHKEAVDAYQNVLELSSGEAEAWNNKGDSYRALAQVEPATESYRQAIRLEPDYASPYHSLGLLAEQAGDNRAALRHFHDAIERHEDDESRAISWNKLGDSHLALNNPEEAARAYRQAIKLAPDFPQPYHSLGSISEQRGQNRAALDYYRQAAERYPAGESYRHEKSRLWNGLGNVHQALEQPQEAVSAWRRAAEFDDTFAAPWSSLGDIYAGVLQQDDAAIDSYSRAIKLEPVQPGPYHNLGLIHERQGDVESAAERFRQALKRYSKGQNLARAESWNHLGNIYYRQGKQDKAIDAYRQAIGNNSNYFEAQASLGDIFAGLKQYDEAIEAFRQAVELNPAAAAPWNSLGNIYHTLERYPEASDAYRQAILLNPTAPQPYHSLGRINETLGNHAPAIEYYEQAIGRYSPDDSAAMAQAWNGLGNIYQMQSRNALAANACLKAIELDPDLAAAHHSLGRLESKAERFEAAIIHYRQAIERYPAAGRAAFEEQAACWNDLGDALGAVQRYDEAVEAYRQAIDLDIGYALPWYNLGNVYRVTAHTNQATRAYEQAIKLNPDHAWSYNNLALVKGQTGEHQQAIDLYRQAIERHTRRQDKAISWNNLGDACHTLQRHNKAAEAYRQAIELDPQFARPWKGLGDTYMAQGHSNGVVEAYQQAINLDPGYAWPYHSLGLIYKNNGAYSQAVTFYRQAIERHTQDADRAVSCNGLGNVYLAMGQYEPAISAYQRALQLNPDDAWPCHNLGFVYQQLNAPQRAIGLYLQAIDRFGSNNRLKAVSWNNLGNVYSTLRRNDDAVNAYQTSIALNKDYALPWNSLGETWFRQEKTGEALKAYQEAIRLYPDYVLAWNNLGDAYWKSGRYRESVQAYEKAIGLDDRYVWPYHNLALVYDERGDYEAALKYYQLAVARHTSAEHRAGLCDKMGDLYRIMGETEQAVERYRQAIAFDAAYASPWYSLANIFAAQEQDNEAITAYRRAIELKPEAPWPYHNLAVVYEKREEYGEAIALYKAAIERHHGDRERAVSWDSLGNIYRDLNRLEEAVHAFRESIKLNPDYALPWNSLGDVYYALSDYKQAAEAYQRAIALDPDYVWAYNNLGTTYQSMGKPEPAIDIYRQVIERGDDHPDLAVSWNSLGDIYDSLKREAEAIAAYEQAIRLDPDYNWAYNRLGAIYERRGDSDQAFALYRQATRRHRQRSAG